jgi:hypothetical protein
MIVFVVLGEGGVGRGVASRGRCGGGGMIDGEDGAAMPSSYQYVVTLT